MQMRYDLLICYGAIGLSLLCNLILPLPIPLQMLLLIPSILYVGSHQAAQTTREKSQSTPSVKHSGDLYLFPICIAIILFALYLTFYILPFGLLSLLFTTTTLIISTLTLAQRINIILIGLSTEEQEQHFRGHKCNIPLQHINQAIRPALQSIKSGGINGPCQYTSYLKNAFQSVKTFIIEKVDGKDVAQQVAEYDQANSNSSDSCCLFGGLNLPPSPTSQGTSLTWSGVDTDILPDIITLDGVSAFSFGVSTFITFLYLITRFSLFHNIFAVALILHFVELINLGSVLNAITFIGSICIYDLIWFFGMKVRVQATDAVSSDQIVQPIVQIALAPLDLYFSHSTQPIMLGIANVIFPALIIALFLRFDMFVAKSFKHRDANVTPVNLIVNSLGSLSFITIATDYFNLSLVGFTLGLLINGIITAVTATSQPSLLYTIPFTLGLPLGLSFVFWKSEFDQLMAFVDEPEDAKETFPSPGTSSGARLSVSNPTPPKFD